MVKTRGLSHLNLAVKDLDRSLRFYRRLFGVREYYRDDASLQVLGPGRYDVIAFEKNAASAGKTKGISHFGFRLKDPKDVGIAIREAKAAGGKILRKGEFSPGFPYVYVEDPDGYEIEIWYE
jgi:catechol 2,3-dioxygenase-like lactoylglutathione lyase family enzyme